VSKTSIIRGDGIGKKSIAYFEISAMGGEKREYKTLFFAIT